MRRLLHLLAFLLLGAACGGASDGACVDLSNKAIGLYQEFVSAVDGLDLAAAVESEAGFSVPGQENFDRRAEALQVEAEIAGCEDEELRRLIAERFNRLEARTVFGQAVLDEIRREGLFFE